MRGAKMPQIVGVTGAKLPKFSPAPQLLLSVTSDNHKLSLADKLSALPSLSFFAQSGKAMATHRQHIPAFSFKRSHGPLKYFSVFDIS
jgi:hypothetical protein